MAEHTTPPAAIPAAPSEVSHPKQGDVLTFSAGGESFTEVVGGFNEGGQLSAPATYKRTLPLMSAMVREIYRLRAALTQPTTVQQADAGDALLTFAPKLQGVSGPEPTLERIIRRYYIEQIDDEVDAEHFAEDYIAHLRRFLKTAQTTALPGGNGEGES